MKRTSLYRGMALAAGLVAGIAGFATLASAHDPEYGPGSGYGGYGMGPGMMGPGYGGQYGPGMMGPGYGRSYGMGPGMMGPGYGRGYGMGPGMMGPGYGRGYGMGPGYGGQYGPGMMGPGYGRGYGQQYGPGYNSQPNVNVTVDSVRSEMDRWVASQGNPNIKVGEVKEKDANTITADIVTKKENALVQRFEVDRKTGAYHPGGS